MKLLRASVFGLQMKRSYASRTFLAWCSKEPSECGWAIVRNAKNISEKCVFLDKTWTIMIQLIKNWFWVVSGYVGTLTGIIRSNICKKRKLSATRLLRFPECGMALMRKT